LVSLDKTNLLLTFESSKRRAIPGTYMISVFASLSKYPMVPALEFPFKFTLLESNQAPETSVEQK
jgi:hypothetical protein